VTREEIKELLNEAEKRFASEAKLIKLESGKVIFVGDTHGDLEATEKIMHKYLKSDNKIVFLGDYVDRGPDSLENINFLLGRKLERPDSLYLLMGNHEGHAVVSFYPANFNFASDMGRFFPACHLQHPRQMVSLLCTEHYPMCPAWRI